MKSEEILKIKPNILQQEDREFYFENGYLLLKSIVTDEWLNILRKTTNEKIEKSKELKESDEVYDLDKGHSYENPRLRRLSSPNDHDENYWNYASKFLPNIISDLVGPDVKFHHSKLNFKWSKGGAEVKWHQDIQFWPHTNYSPLTVGTYLYDCDLDQGPLAVIPKSHNGPLYNQYENDKWTGCLSSNDEKKINKDEIVYLDGPAGSLTIHNARSLHFSPSSKSKNPRPLLLNCFTSADAKAYTAHPQPTSNTYKIVRGENVKWAHHDPRPCQMPPDWSGGYTSIYAAQSGEDKS